MSKNEGRKNRRKKKKPASSSKDIGTPLFIAALFQIAKTWKQLKYLSTDDWIEKLWDIYSMELYIQLYIQQLKNGGGLFYNLINH